MFSKPYINKMLQATNAETLPMRLNSVRHIEPYKGSLDSQDLLDLYVGDTNYRQINKALRSPDIQTARQQVWDEAGLMKPKSSYPNLPETYNVLMSSVTPAYDGQDVIKQFVSNAKDEAFDTLELTPEHKLKDIPTGTVFKYHPLTYTEGFSKLPLGQQAEQIFDYKLPDRIISLPSIKNRYNAQNYLNQTLASIPNVEQVVLSQPAHQLEEVVNSRPHMHKKIAKLFDDYLDKVNMTGDKNIDEDTSLAIDNYITTEDQKLWGLVDNNYKYKPDAIHKHISDLRKIDTPLQIVKQPINRGLHFKNEFDYNNFISQHQPGQVIEYPSFTSTTIRPSIQAGFANERRGEIPVFQSFELTPGQSEFNAYDVNNEIEGERLYPPGQRFKVLSSDGTNMILQETNELTPIEQRVNSILSQMRPRLANLA